jgi:hypothetical protein
MAAVAADIHPEVVAVDIHPVVAEAGVHPAAAEAAVIRRGVIARRGYCQIVKAVRTGQDRQL